MPAITPQGYRADLDNVQIANHFEQDPVAAWLDCYDGVAALAAFPRLMDQLASAHVVIGFELPPVMRRAIADRGGRYISVHINPLRFLPDLVLGVHSNCPVIRKALTAVSVPEDLVKPHVARFSARFARLAPCQAELPDGCPVLFGQSVTDASLISAGRIRMWSDYRDKLNDLLDGYDHLAFVKHPYVNWPVETIEWLRRHLGKTVIAMAGNGYPVIMSGRSLGPVISLSSSIGVEAAAFGHESHFLLADPRRAFGVPGLDNELQIMVGHQLLGEALWKAVLNRDSLPNDVAINPFQLGADYVRGSLDSWSYAGIAGAAALPECTKIVMPSQRSTAADIDRLVAALAGQDADALAPRGAIIAEAARGGVHLRIFPPVLSSGMPWQWDRATECLNLPGADGFGRVEVHNTWLESERCEIQLPLRGSKGRSQRLLGSIRFSFFDGLINDYPVLLLRANGHPVSAWVHRGSDDRHHRLPFDFHMPSSDWCSLSLEVSHRASPAAVGIGEDSRQLGISIFDLSIAVTDSNRMDDDDLLSIWGFGETSIQVPAWVDWEAHVQPN